MLKMAIVFFTVIFFNTEDIKNALSVDLCDEIRLNVRASAASQNPFEL